MEIDTYFNNDTITQITRLCRLNGLPWAPYKTDAFVFLFINQIIVIPTS